MRPNEVWISERPPLQRTVPLPDTGKAPWSSAPPGPRYWSTWPKIERYGVTPRTKERPGAGRLRRHRDEEPPSPVVTILPALLRRTRTWDRGKALSARCVQG